MPVFCQPVFIEWLLWAPRRLCSDSWGCPRPKEHLGGEGRGHGRVAVVVSYVRAWQN